MKIKVQIRREAAGITSENGCEVELPTDYFPEDPLESNGDRELERAAAAVKALLAALLSRSATDHGPRTTDK